jgi:colicin import membrane protein
MSAAVASPQFSRRRVEPGKLPAGLLALGVHIVFFALIVFGVSWNVKPPDPIAVEVWSALPPIQNAQNVQAVAVLPPTLPTPTPPEPVIEKVVESPPIAKPAVIPPAVKVQTPPVVDDINLKLAKKKAEEAQKQALSEQLQKEKLKEDAKKKELLEAQKAAEKIKLAEEAKKTEAAQQLARAAAAEQLAAQIAAQNIQAARNAAIASYGSKIAELIRNRANVPDTVVGNPIVQVRLRLLANGAVLDATVVKPSGNRPYDESVERAINSIRNWPLPDNPEILGQRKELNLNIRHEK